MKEIGEPQQNIQEILPPLTPLQSTQTKSVNLNELIRIHRYRQRFEIVDKFFNNSYIQIQNKVQPIEIYYQFDRFKSYLQDLNLIYFKQIEFTQNVRLEYILRRLNFTLNGEQHSTHSSIKDFKQFLVQNHVYDKISEIYSEQVMKDVQNTSNQSKIVDTRNMLFLSYLINQLHTLPFTPHQYEQLFQKIPKLYEQLGRKIKDNTNQYEEEIEIALNRHQCPVNSMTNHSDKSHTGEIQEKEDNIIKYVKEHLQNHMIPEKEQKNAVSFYADDTLYEQEICLKIIELQIQNQYLINQINDPMLDEEHATLQKLEYLYEINKEYIVKLKELRDVNNTNRLIFKKIQKNLSIEYKINNKCIVNEDCHRIESYFTKPIHIETHQDLMKDKYQKVYDTQCAQKILSKVIQKLHFKLVADAISVAYDIDRDDSKESKNFGKLLFSVCFEHGLGVNSAVLGQKDFLYLNNLREQSTLTSYLTPMKSTFSYISHNIYTFLQILEKDFMYSRQTNNNEEVIKKIRSKMARNTVLGKIQQKEYFFNGFKICHNCKILCPRSFLKQCKRRVKHEKNVNEEESDSCDDSLYTQKNFKNPKNNRAYIFECQKNFCIYCINNQFSGKLFNDKGWCPACLDNCQCNTCLREKMVHKLIDLYVYLGGDKNSLKTEKQIIDQMRVKHHPTHKHEQYSEIDSLDYSQIEEKVYESVIKKEMIRGYSASKVNLALLEQQEMMELVIHREYLKLENVKMEKAIFRKKIASFNVSLDHIDKEIEQEEEKNMLEKQIQLEKEREQQRKRKRQRLMSRQGRKCRKLIKPSQVFQDFYQYDISESQSESSSFHISNYFVKQNERNSKKEHMNPSTPFDSDPSFNNQNQTYNQKMILGKEMTMIKKQDYLHRFILLQRILSKYGENLLSNDDSSESSIDYSRYQKILNELEQVQKLTLSYNNDASNRQLEIALILNDFEEQYRNINVELEESIKSYEQKLMKTWRETINMKKKRDVVYRNDRKMKGGNNKNLMFLASEILKKQRKTASLLDKQVKRVFEQIQSLTQMLQEQEKAIKEERNDLEKYIDVEKRKKSHLFLKSESFLEKSQSINDNFSQFKEKVENQFHQLKATAEKSQHELLLVLESILSKLK